MVGKLVGKKRELLTKPCKQLFLEGKQKPTNKQIANIE